MSLDVGRRIKDSLSDRDLNELFAAVETTRNSLAAASKDFPSELKFADPILKIAQTVPTTLEEFRTIPSVGKYTDQYGTAFINTVNQFISQKRTDNDPIPMEVELSVPVPVAQPITVAPPKNTQETEVIRRAKEMGFTPQIIEEGLKRVKDTGIPLSNFEMIVDILFNVQHAKQNINRTASNNNKPLPPPLRKGPPIVSMGPPKVMVPVKENKASPSKQENKASPSKQASKCNSNIILESETTTTNKSENKEILSELGKEDLDAANECKICFDNEINCLLLPCAHFVICLQCTKTVNECPVCRKKFTAVQKFFRA